MKIIAYGFAPSWRASPGFSSPSSWIPCSLPKPVNFTNLRHRRCRTGGCSLRGGVGSILGVVIAAAVIRLIYNSINMLGISTHLEFGILGIVILLGVMADEFLKRYPPNAPPPNKRNPK